MQKIINVPPNIALKEDGEAECYFVSRDRERKKSSQLIKFKMNFLSIIKIIGF